VFSDFRLVDKEELEKANSAWSQKEQWRIRRKRKPMLHFRPIATHQIRVQSDTRQKTVVWSSSRTLRASVDSFKPPRTACVTPSICSTVRHLPEETSTHPVPGMISQILIWIASWNKFRSLFNPQHPWKHHVFSIKFLQYATNWDSFFDVVTNLLISRPSNHGSILGKGKRYLSILRNVPTVFETHPTSYLIRAGVFSRVKTERREAKHSALFNVEVKNEWSETTTPEYAFIVCTGTILPLSFGTNLLGPFCECP